MLLQAAGCLFIFKIRQYEIRREIKQRIKAGAPDQELSLIKIPKTLEEKPHPAFRRIDEGEFRYDGNMYDVVRQEAHGDTTWYYCLSDEKETQLFANLDDLVKREMSRDTEQKQRLVRLLDWLGSLFFDHRREVAFAFSAEEIELTHGAFGLKTWIGTPLTPPPEG